MEKTMGLLLEGGALRSVFTAGVLDYFMDMNFYVPNVMALSASAYAGMNYIAKQRGRTEEINIESLREEKYLGIRTFLKKGELFDMDMLFDKYPNGEKPFDYDTFMNSSQHFTMSTVNCNTGLPIYYDHFDDPKKLMQIARASNSLPFLSKVVYIDGIPMLDGGMYDAIPIDKTLEDGIDKIIVVLTRLESYRKVPRHIYMLGLRLLYRKYPEFVKMVADRPNRYNHAIDTINRLEREGKAYVIRPEVKPVKNNESNPDKLKAFYQHGYECAKNHFEKLQKFLAEP